MVNKKLKVENYTYPSSLIIWNVVLESLAIATQLLAKIPYGAEKKDSTLEYEDKRNPSDRLNNQD